MAYEYDYSALGYSPYGAMAPETFSQVASPYAIPAMGVTSAMPASAMEMAPSSFAVDPQGYQFVTNKGKLAGTKANPTGYVTADPNAQYRFVNLRGDDSVMYEGTGAEGLQGVYDLARQQSTDLGKKAYWSAEQYDPTTESWVSVADDPRGGLKGAINKYGDIALPALGALMMAIPGMQPFGLTAALSGAGGAAAGSALSSALQGRSLEGTLGRALLSGVTAYGGAQLAPAISGALSAPTSAATNTATSEVAKAAISEGAKQALQQTAGQALGDTIFVTGLREAAKAAVPTAIGAGVGGLSSAGLSKLPATGPKGPTAPRGETGSVIDVTASRIPQTVPNLEAMLGAPAAIPGALAGNILPSAPSANPDEIVVTGKRAEPVLGSLAAAGVPAVSAAAAGAALNALTGTQAPTQKPTEKPTGEQGSTLSQISDWLNAASTISSLLGPLAGGLGGGKGGNRSINAAGLGGLSPVFGAQLPPSNMPAMQPRTMPQQDWNRYAFGPEQSFFTNVPQRLAKGGLAHSDGRSDDVPAMLSRGEYVIDAETMALLGNGDPFAGADKMDEWRVNVRKHKGRQLMKGDISPDAKMPNQYMGGGRV